MFITDDPEAEVAILEPQPKLPVDDGDLHGRPRCRVRERYQLKELSGVGARQAG